MVMVVVKDAIQLKNMNTVFVPTVVIIIMLLPLRLPWLVLLVVMAWDADYPDIITQS